MRYTFCSGWRIEFENMLYVWRLHVAEHDTQASRSAVRRRLHQNLIFLFSLRRCPTHLRRSSIVTPKTIASAIDDRLNAFLLIAFHSTLAFSVTVRLYAPQSNM